MNFLVFSFYVCSSSGFFTTAACSSTIFNAKVRFSYLEVSLLSLLK